LVIFVNLIKGWDAISASIDPGNYKFAAGGDMVIQVSITNLKDETVYLLNWDTPFVEHGNYLAIVSKDTTTRLPYHGLIAKRGNAGVGSYITLKPKETRSVKVNVFKNYPLHKAGVYLVKLSFLFKDYSFNPSEIPKVKDHFKISSLVESNTVEIEIIGTYVPAARNESHLLDTKKRYGSDFSTRYCTSTQITKIQTAWNAFERMIGNSEYYIKQGNTASYRTWFGAYTTTRYTRVKNVIMAIRNLINYYDACAFDCSLSHCEPDYYAFVYPTDTSRTVHLCQVFWSTIVGGNYRLDTQAGTIVHELSHFDAIGNPGNEDYFYGETNLRNLALSNPDNAVRNADSYEYYSESIFNN